MEDLQPSTVDDGRCVEEPRAPHAELEQAKMDLVAPTVEQPTVARPTAPTTEEPLAIGPTLPSGGLHDEGNLGVEEVWGAAATSSGLAGVSTEPAGDAPSSAARGPPVVAGQVAAMEEAALGHLVRAR